MKQYASNYKWQLIAVLALAISALIDPALAANAAPFIGVIGVVDTIKSSVITNADASPVVLNSAQLSGGRLRFKRGWGTTVTAAAEAGSTIRCFRVKSNDLVALMFLDCTAFGTGCTANIGLYKTTADGGAVVDADFFASAVDISAALVQSNVTREAAGTPNAVNYMEKCIWEALGLSTDPQIEYDVAITLGAAATGTGTACLSAAVVGRN